jgi:putative membrane protein
MTKNNRSPQAFVIEEEPSTKKTTPHKRPLPAITFAVEEPEQDIALVPNNVKLPAARGLRWGSILIGALFTLFSLWAGLTISQVIEGFFVRSATLGWIALSVAGLAAFAAFAIILREIWGLARLRRIEKLQLTAAHALNQDDEASANQAISSLTALYRSKPDAAWNLKNYEIHANDIMDPRDRIRLAERYLVDPLDDPAHRIIARRAKRVILLTTVTPAAALDILFVAAQNIAMLREIATLYGGRPSTFATLKLTRMVITHLAIAGGLALSENFLHLFVGKGILGRLSARFGEGAVNGILTSRIGLAACEVCRPIPKESTKRETLGSLLKELASFGDKEVGSKPI